MTGTDPTLEFLATFDDPEKYVVVHDAPICIPHERTVPKPDGENQTIVVGEQDLFEIAQQLIDRENQFGVLPVMTLGHRQQTDPAFPEKQQPDIVGYSRHHRVGRFGPGQKPAVLATLYYKREDWDEAKKYPFRSMDFYPGSKKVTGIALLKRDPYLPLGMVTYQNPEASVAPTPVQQESIPYSWVDTIADSAATGIGKTLLIPIAVPLGMLRGALRNLPGGESVGMQNDQPVAPAAPAAPPAQGGAEPPGYAEWLACFEYALKTHPALMPLAKKMDGAGGDGAAKPEAPPEEGGDEKPGQYAMTDNQAAWQKVANRQIARANPMAPPPVSAMQQQNSPVAYAAVIEQLQRKDAAREKEMAELRQKVAIQEGKTASKEADLLTYELANAGILALYTNGNLDQTKFQAMSAHLAKLPEKTRQARFDDIKTNYAKDATVVYASAGAPSGGFVGIPQNYQAPTQDPNAPLSLEQGEAVIEYMRTNRAEFAKLSADAAYAQAKAKVLGKK